MNNFNTNIIEEFRNNKGKVAGPFQGMPMVILTTKGRRTGKPHETPLVPLEDDGKLFVFGSMGGAPKHPAWFLNLRDNPRVTVEHGTDKFEAEAKIISGEEHDRIYAKQAQRVPQFAEYQTKTTRQIPVVELQPIR